MRVVVPLVLMLLFAAPALGQTAGEPLAPDNTTLYAHALAADTSVLYLGTVTPGEDPQSYNGGVQSAGAGSGSFGWTISGPAAVEQPLPLDGQVHVEVFVGGSTSSGMVDLSWTLSVGDTVIAEGEPKGVTFIAEYQGASWDVDPLVEELPVGVFNLEISGTGDRTGAFLSVGERRNHGTTGRDFAGPTHVELPIAAGAPVAGPEAIEETLEGDAISLAFDEPTNDTYAYTYATDLESVLVSGAIVPEAGTVALTIEDGAGTVLYDEELAGETDLDEVFDQVAAGDWNITLAFTDFTGTVDLAFEEPPTDASTDSGTQADGTEDSGDVSDANATTDPADASPAAPQEASTKESPGAGLLAVLALVGAAFAVRRR